MAPPNIYFKGLSRGIKYTSVSVDFSFKYDTVPEIIEIRKDENDQYI